MLRDPSFPTIGIYRAVDNSIHDTICKFLSGYVLLNTNKIINISTVYLITILY